MKVLLNLLVLHKGIAKTLGLRRVTEGRLVLNGNKWNKLLIVRIRDGLMKKNSDTIQIFFAINY